MGISPPHGTCLVNFPVPANSFLGSNVLPTPFQYYFPAGWFFFFALPLLWKERFRCRASAKPYPAKTAHTANPIYFAFTLTSSRRKRCQFLIPRPKSERAKFLSGLRTFKCSPPFKETLPESPVFMLVCLTFFIQVTDPLLTGLQEIWIMAGHTTKERVFPPLGSLRSY